MRIFEIFSESKKQKAGLIPYFINDDGTVEMLFMISSNSSFGGSAPMISKGGVEHGEVPAEAAIREAEEELGLNESNIKGNLIEVSREVIRGLTENYIFYCFGAEVKDKNNFGKFHYETKETVWLTNSEFQKIGRRIHRIIVQKLFDKISKDK